jgi:hypothetical protein
MNRVTPPTFRELSLAALEQINELARQPEWLKSRRIILDLSHEAVQRLNNMDDSVLDFSYEELHLLQTAVQSIYFAPSPLSGNWKPLLDKIAVAINQRKK